MADRSVDFKLLCAELLSELEDRFTISEPADDPLIQRARAALAAEPQEPTFTPEEVELHQAPWSYLSPPAAVDSPQPPPDHA